MSKRAHPPGRPAAFSRQAAIDGALNLFWQEGYLGVATRDIAKAMNIQRSSFYNSFGDREAVFVNALHRYAEIAPDRILDKAQPGKPVIPILITFFQQLCEERVADENGRGCFVCNSIAELVGVDKNLGPLLRGVVQQRQAAIARLLQIAVEQQEIELATDVQSAANSLTTFLIGFNLFCKTTRDEATLKNTCRAFLLGLGVKRADMPAMDA